MGLSTPQERLNLASQSLITDYQRQKSHLVAIAKVVYNAVEGSLQYPSTAADLENALALALYRSSLYGAILQKKPHINPILYQGYASALARILLDDDWNMIKA